MTKQQSLQDFLKDLKDTIEREYEKSFIEVMTHSTPQEKIFREISVLLRYIRIKRKNKNK
jgi:hypothetical protein